MKRTHLGPVVPTLHENQMTDMVGLHYLYKKQANDINLNYLKTSIRYMHPGAYQSVYTGINTYVKQKHSYLFSNKSERSRNQNAHENKPVLKVCISVLHINGSNTAANNYQSEFDYQLQNVEIKNRQNNNFMVCLRKVHPN